MVLTETRVSNCTKYHAVMRGAVGIC